MRRRIVFTIFGVFFTIQLQAADYIVKFKSAGMMNFKSFYGMPIVDEHDVGQLVQLRINEKNQAEYLAELMADPDVEYVVKDFKLHALRAPFNAQALRDQWAIAKVNAEAAWAKAGNRGSRNVLVAVIDTGVDYRHVALSPNMVAGYDFHGNDSDPMDETGSANPGHGTHCAGIVGATGLIDGGTIGLSPEVSIMPLRFLGADGSGNLMNGVKAIDHAIEKGAEIISASWGAKVPRSQAAPLVEAVERADNAGVIFIAAAANDGANNDSTEMYPANSGFPNTITVAATGSQDEKPSWSNYGLKTVHVSAPGLEIMSTLPNNAYKNLSGTSMATPLVSGLAAFLLAQDSTLTGAQIRSILQTSGAQIGIDVACKCRVDALAAVETVLNKPMYTVPAAATLAPQEAMQLEIANGTAPYTYASSNPAAVTVADTGIMTGVADGESVITVTDSAGTTAKTMTIRVGQSTPSNPGGDCPLGDPLMCELVCGIMPEMPWCN